MPETTAREITVEKTPAYFVSRTAPGRIRSLNSTIKLIVVVRNPITRAISGNLTKYYLNSLFLAPQKFQQMAYMISNILFFLYR